MNAEPAYRPRRSCLYMPGSNARALEKARALPADVLLLDLEDAVAPALKHTARRQIAAALEQGGYGSREIVLRVNGIGTPWFEEDLRQAVVSGSDGVLVPKVETAAQVAALDKALSAAGAAGDFGLWIMVETPLAVLNIAGMAAAAQATRLAALVVGTNDLAKDMRVVPAPDRGCFTYALSAVVLAARAYGLIAIDGVFNAIDDPAALEAECRQGRDLGFEGKSLIHPAQLEAANRVFAPDPRALAEARVIVAAFAQHEGDEVGVISVEGRMVELLHLQEARRLLAVERAIGEAREQDRT